MRWNSTKTTSAHCPLFSLNGSLIGYLTRSDSGALAFEEIDAFPLAQSELDGVLQRIDALLTDRRKAFLVFWCPRDWTAGERIRAFREHRVEAVCIRYPSASAVVAGKPDGLRQAWTRHEVCMLLLLLDVSQYRLMACQHAERERFLVRAGVDKLHGAHRITESLQVALSDCVGTGDTAMDTFLDGEGLAVTVGEAAPPLNGVSETVRVRDSAQLGRLFHRIAELHGPDAG
jgi:hypothetical protein